jgi:hypothetical protein
MNWMPADSSAEQIFIPVSSRPPNGPSRASKRLIVGMETSAAAANSSCDQARSERAALTCLIDTFSIDLAAMVCDTFSIERPELPSSVLEKANNA